MNRQQEQSEKLNVTVYNVPESEATTGLERKEEDLNKLNNLFKEYIYKSVQKLLKLHDLAREMVNHNY